MQNQTAKVEVKPESELIMMEVRREGESLFNKEQIVTLSEAFRVLAPICKAIIFNFGRDDLTLEITLKATCMKAVYRTERSNIMADIKIPNDAIAEIIDHPDTPKSLVEMVANRIYLDLSDSEYMVTLDAKYPEIMEAMRWIKENFPNATYPHPVTGGILPLAEKLIHSIDESGFECTAGTLENFQPWQQLKELIRDHYPQVMTEEKFEEQTAGKPE